MADADPQVSSRIFISYRREDSSGHVLALLPALRKQFGADRIFKDTDNIPPGSDFLKFIKRELESCSVLLAIIGRDWLNVQDPRQKRRRLDNPDDFLRVEVSTALKNERIRVIPVLVDRGTVPAAEDLPADLADLSYRNAVELSDGRWDSDVQLLIQAIERATTVAPAPPKPPERPDLADLQRRRAREIASHVAAATQAFDSHDYEGTIWACEKALLLDPQHAEALQTLDRARKAIDEQKIEGWLKDARDAMERGEIGDASDLIDQALAVDSTSETALALRKDMLALRRERERERERVRALRAALDRARTSLDEEDFESAVRHADDALAVEPSDADALTIRTSASKALEERRRQREHKRRAQQTAADARRKFAGGERGAAIQLLKDFTPPHDVVSETLAELQKESADLSDRQQRVAELIGRAKEALESGKFDDAISRGFDISAIEPDSPEVAALIKEAQERKTAAIAARRAKQQAELKLGEAATKLEEQDFDAARKLVETARSHDPKHPEIAPLLARIETARSEHAALVRRMASIRAAADAARHSFDSGEFEQAIRHSDVALALDPALTDIQALRDNAETALAQRHAREQHERLARQEVEQARAMFEAKEYGEALDLLDRFQPPHVLVIEALEDLRAQFDAIEARRRHEEAEAARLREEAERRERERQERERQERERQEREQREKERQERERKERERLAREAEERARVEAEKAAAARKAAEAREREKKQEQVAREREKEERLARQAATATPQAAPTPQITEAPPRSPTWRPSTATLAAAAAIVLVASIAVWYYGHTSPPPQTQAVDQSPRPTPPPAVQPPAATAQPPAKAPAEKTQPAPADGGASGTGPATAGTSTSATPAPTPSARDEARERRLDTLRDTARSHLQSGRRASALNTAVTGLKEEPNDTELSAVVDTLLRDAQGASQRARASALNADAPMLARVAFGEGDSLEEDAKRLIAENQKDGAIRALWRAETRFNAAWKEALSAAAEQARLKQQEADRAKQKEIADEQARRKPVEQKPTEPSPQPQGRGAAPATPTEEKKVAEARPTPGPDKSTAAAPKPALSREDEQERVNAVLQRYEAGYDKLNARGVKAVYPGAPDNLDATFAQFEFYRLEMVCDPAKLTADMNAATVECQMFHAFKARGPFPARNEKRREEFSLQRRGDGWIIVGIQKR